MAGNENNNQLLEIVLDSWDRNNAILINLLHALPAGGLEARAIPGSRTVAEMLTHIHYVRLVFLSENLPEFANDAPEKEWIKEQNPSRIADELARSGEAVREAVRDCVSSGREMKLHYDHPILYLQHMIWHEGYHHGQIKLALKANGTPLDDKYIGRLTWRLWFDKTAGKP